ncbi:MAG: hypothetical protein WDN75_14500 [Bacteroidota bacterium]
MKTILWIALLCTVPGCTTSPRETTSAQDSTLTKVAVADSGIVTPLIPVPEKHPLVISDSNAQAINDLVNAQLEKIYADTATFYKATYIDYYDEWEGQAEMKITTWYFDKDLAVVYSNYSYQNGAMEKPDETEYVLRNDSTIGVKEDYYSAYEERLITLWTAQKGGVKLTWTTYSNAIKSAAPIPDDYAAKTQDSWNSSFDLLKSILAAGPIEPDSRGICTILEEKPKQAELTDYTRMTIPKIVVDKLLSDSK